MLLMGLFFVWQSLRCIIYFWFGVNNMRVFYAEEMRLLDRIAMEKYKIPGIVLMENAALECVKEIEKSYKDFMYPKVGIFCGRGNNGGDGFAIARHLHNKGYNVTVFLTAGDNILDDALINFEIINQLGIKVVNLQNAPQNLDEFDLIIDAIFGTGFKGEAEGLFKDVINSINNSLTYTIAVDIPSGVNADTGEVASICVKADKTITFAAYKAGLLLYPGADYVGEIVVGDISVPKAAFDEIKSNIRVTDKSFFTKNMPKRQKNSHKGDYGKLLVIAGSKGMTGAAYLSSQSAMLSGSGLVTLATPDVVNDILEIKTTEVMTMPLNSCGGHISSLAIEDIKDKLGKVDAVLIGPGLGVSNDVKEILKMLLKNSHIPLIIDADAINTLADDKEVLQNKNCEVILTPHDVEFLRISGLSKKEIESNRLAVCRDFAKEFDVTLILKGSHSIVTASDGMQYINMTGNPGLATGGSGDVLSGIVASFVSRGIPPANAAAMAVYLHGICGDIASNKYGEESVVASSIMDSIPKVYNQILQVEK